MTTEEVFQYNKRCALFLGWKETTLEFKMKWVGTKFSDRLSELSSSVIPILEKDNNVYFEDTMYYHSDWNLIMEVVEKIQTLDKLGGIVMIQQGRCKITSRSAGDNTVYADVSHYYLHGMKKQKEAVVEAINQFLIWYNENK